MKQLATMLLVVLALGAIPAQGQTSVTVRDINAFPQESLAAADAQGTNLTVTAAQEAVVSPLEGEDVQFVAVVLSDPRTSGFSSATDGFPSRVHVFVRDTSAVSQGAEGMGIQLVDGAYQTTGLLNAAVGDVVRITGNVDDFTGSGGAAMQVEPSSVEVLGPYQSFDLPDSILDPVTITETSFVNKALAGTDGQVQVNWSNYSSLNGQYVRLEGVTVVGRTLGDRPTWIVSSDGGETVVNITDVSLNYRNDRDGAYNENEFNVRDDDFVPPPPGATVNLQGFLVFQGDDDFARGEPDGVLMSIFPFEQSDLVVTETPPEATATGGPDGVTTSADAVLITAEASADASRSIDTVELTYFSTSNPAPTTVAMTESGGSYSAAIPGQADGDFVIYTITATDNTGASFTSAALEYRVLDNGITEVSHIQEVSGQSPATGSPFAGQTLPMNLEVTVQTEPALSGLISIQDDAALGPWTGILVRTTDELVADLTRGDQITITEGEIEEFFGQTQLTINAYTKTGSGDPLGFKAVTTGLLQDPEIIEAHEGMMLRFEGVEVVNPQADGTRDFGEFTFTTVGDDAPLRVDDASDDFPGEFNDDLTPGDAFQAIQGLLGYSFGNYKIWPETLADVEMVGTDVEDETLPGTFTLSQNYPNPFNPTTSIRYNVPATGDVTLKVVDLLGRDVATLVSGVQTPGQYNVTFDASQLASGLYLYRLTAGGETLTRTMMLLK